MNRPRSDHSPQPLSSVLSGKTFCLASFLLLSPSIASGQALDEAFLRSTVLVSRKQPTPASGSGFLVAADAGVGRVFIFLVTNRHVMPTPGPSRSISLRVNTGTTISPAIRFLEVPVTDSRGQFLDEVWLSADASADLALVNISRVVEREKILATWIPEELLATPDRLKSEHIGVGDEIFILGHPAAIFDPRNEFPVLRVGVIATVPTAGYAFNATLRRQYGLPERIDGFLIDANVFPGSSGSLVILKPQGVTVGSDGAAVVGQKRTPLVLGVVFASIPFSDTVLHSTQRIGLGIVLSAATIRSAIEDYRKQLKRFRLFQ